MHTCDPLQLGSRFLAGACLAAIVSATALAAEVEPYEARVVVTRAQVRSGPGENFYPTDSLDQGETVEVYREHDGGWLAIRPPQNSFSWVFGRHLKLRDGGLAEINKEDVASRIGSRFGQMRNAVQVQLRKGEIVEVLGEDTGSGETWYKIAPPAGEFRWIHATHIQRRTPLTSGVANSEEGAEVVPASATNDRNDDTPASSSINQIPPPAPSANPNQSTADDWRSAPTGAATVQAEIAPPPLADSTNLPPRQSSPVPANSPIASIPTQAAPTSTPATTAAALPDELARQLTDVELRLSRMVAAPPDRWNTERLERDSEELLAQAQTPAERDAVKATLAKLDQFAAIARRYQQPGTATISAGGDAGLATAGAARDSSSPGGQPADSALRPTPMGIPADTSPYDAVGILRPVVSKRPGAPQFALVDDRGQVISFVTPTPDLNLQPYLGHRVGVVGSRGFIPEFQRAHVTAGRVAPLSETVVR